MIFKLDSYFKDNQVMLELLTLKENNIASNIANINTPNYKKVDISFLDEFKKRTQDLHYDEENNFSLNSKKKNILKNDKDNLEKFTSFHDIIDKAYIHCCNNELSKNHLLNDKKSCSDQENSFFYDIENNIINADKKNNLLFQEINNSTLKNIVELEQTSKKIDNNKIKSDEISLTSEKINFVNTELEHKKELAIIKYKIDNILKVLD